MGDKKCGWIVMDIEDFIAKYGDAPIQSGVGIRLTPGWSFHYEGQEPTRQIQS